MIQLEKTHPDLVGAFKRIGLDRVHVEHSRFGELTIWDGYVRHPEKDLQRFDVKEGDHPSGCYATFWAVTKGDRDTPNAMVGFGLFDAFHNPSLTVFERRGLRVRALLDRAKEEFTVAERVRMEERHAVTN